MADLESIESEVKEKEKSYDYTATMKKIAQRMMITIVAALVGGFSTWFLTKFGVEIPDSVKTELIIAIVIFINSAEAGLKNFWKNVDRDADNDGILDKFENLYEKLTSIPVLKQFRFIWDLCFTIKKK